VLNVAASPSSRRSSSGLLFGKAIKAHLFTPTVVASAFIVGGFIILWAERRREPRRASRRWTDMTPLDALKVGLVQCLAMIPGTSRSGRHHHRRHAAGPVAPAATEFSFFLAIPTLIGAGAYSLYKERALLSMGRRADVRRRPAVLVHLSAWVCVRWLLRYMAPQLRALRLVPHRLRPAGAGIGPAGLGELVDPLTIAP
jgi:undecaprenyl-diphosphatase